MAFQPTSLGTFAVQAARDIGCIRAGQTLSQDILNDILEAANQMLDAWLLDQLLVIAAEPHIFNLTPGIQIYTIGPNETAPNFNSFRPTQIEVANIILNTVTPVLRTPLDCINVWQYSSIPVQQLPNALPTRLYYEKSFNAATGAGKLYLWAGPLFAYQLEIYTWDQSNLKAFPDLSTAFIYPPGYQRMIRKNLGVEIAPLMTMYCKSARADGIMAPAAAMLELVKQQAEESLAVVRDYNAPEETLVGDPGFLGNSSRMNFNWLLGTNGRTGR